MKSSRRNFLQHSLLGSAGLGLGIASTAEVRADPAATTAEPEIAQDVDVLVVGGGTATHVAKQGITPLEVPLKEIHDLLRAHNAIIPGDV